VAAAGGGGAVSNLERNLVQIALAAIAVAAVYDLFVLNQGKAVVSLATTSFKGFGGILARVTGQKPPAGY
jgi:hypothetical protein